MRNIDSTVKFVDEKSLQRVADKASLDNYLREQQHSCDDVRYLMSPALRESVRELVSGLSGKEQTIVRMRYWDDRSIEEIAEALDLDKGTVEEHLTKTLAKLRAQILEKGQRHLKNRDNLPLKVSQEPKGA